MKKSDLKKLIRESITSETQLNEIQNCHCTAKNELGIYNIYYGGPDTPCGGPVVPFGHAACCSTVHLGNVSTAWVDAQPCLNWYGVGGGGQLPGSGKIPGTMDVVTTGVGVKPGDINRLKDPSMKQGRLREEKDKKKLKDIILKTLEKEGGAAGIKALAKAAKTSKGKLKKDLDDMSGVKQHKHGDYISTPLNEAPNTCSCQYSDSGDEEVTDINVQNCGDFSNCEACCTDYKDLHGWEECWTCGDDFAASGPTGGGINQLKDPRLQGKIAGDFEQERERMKRLEKILSTVSRNYRRRMEENISEISGLGEVKDHIFELVTEKLCAKGKAYIAKRKRAGEKSSAYLSGRAVKVCKGQMKG